ncbi:MAG: hydroxyacylglutathione hydrolase [Comamonadaceae bacterium]|nr:MAG: hydroxyacylglutathione hydrolase [Comamonadaceae bacterium]
MPQVHQAILPIPAFSDNYIWMIRHGQSAVVVDPGQAEPVQDALRAAGLSLVAILLTHHHNDHVGGVQALVDQWGCRVWGPAHERLPVCDVRVAQGDRVELPDVGISLEVIDVPGHTAGHVAYAGSAGGQPSVLFSGDTLFAAGCGRLFEGTAAQMYDSFEKILSLPLETSVFCGHEYTLANLRWALAVDSDNAVLQEAFLRAQHLRAQDTPTLPTTLGQERATNPFARTHHPAVAAAAARWAGHPLADPVDVFGALREWKNNFK